MAKLLLIGEKYGSLTVLKEAPRGKHGERRYICRCDCGNTDSFDVYNITKNLNHRCCKCVPHTGGKPKPDIIGKQIHGWEVLTEHGRNKHGSQLFKCRCMQCGNISFKTLGQMNQRKTARCDKCPPMYHFIIEGETATGTLPNGEGFLIDAADIPLINQYRWINGKGGYVVTHSPSLKLHRLITGVNDPKVMVDHINRNRKDCRRENLRIISTFGNSANHSLFETNKTGYTGVYYSKCSGRYEVKVGYDHRRILLGTSRDDLTTLAQMYNVAASFFFGEYAGALNDVPDPPDELVARVIAKCQKYMKTPASPGVFVA